MFPANNFAPAPARPFGNASAPPAIPLQNGNNAVSEPFGVIICPLTPVTTIFYPECDKSSATCTICAIQPPRAPQFVKLSLLLLIVSILLGNALGIACVVVALVCACIVSACYCNGYQMWMCMSKKNRCIFNFVTNTFQFPCT